jgi:hypothetical protein
MTTKGRTPLTLLSNCFSKGFDGHFVLTQHGQFRRFFHVMDRSLNQQTKKKP